MKAPSWSTQLEQGESWQEALQDPAFLFTGLQPTSELVIPQKSNSFYFVLLL